MLKNEVGINISIYVQNLYPERYKTVKKEIKELNKCRDISHSWMGRLNIISCQFFLK